MQYYIINTTYQPAKVGARRTAKTGRIISAHDQADAEARAKKYVENMQTFDRSIELVSVTQYSAGR
jgi:hypothetical protein